MYTLSIESGRLGSYGAAKSHRSRESLCLLDSGPSPPRSDLEAGAVPARGAHDPVPRASMVRDCGKLNVRRNLE